MSVAFWPVAYQEQDIKQFLENQVTSTSDVIFARCISVRIIGLGTIVLGLTGLVWGEFGVVWL